MLQETVTKTSWRDSFDTRESAITHGSRRPQTEKVGDHQWEKPVVSSRQRGMKPQSKNAGGRKSESILIILNPNLRLSKVQYDVRIKNRSLQTPTSVQELTINLPQNPRLRGTVWHFLPTFWEWFIYRIYSVWKNSSFKVSDKPRHVTDQKHANYLPWMHNRFKQIILCMNLLMYVVTIQCYSGLDLKKYNLQFIFLIHLWPRSKLKVMKPKMKCRPRARL